MSAWNQRAIGLPVVADGPRLPRRRNSIGIGELGAREQRPALYWQADNGDTAIGR